MEGRGEEGKERRGGRGKKERKVKGQNWMVVNWERKRKCVKK